MRSFLSPYGDGTIRQLLPDGGGQFSPPYGDGTAVSSLKYRVTAFSPPYGDGTARVSHVRPLFAVFAPLRGWYEYAYLPGNGQLVFAPLRGWYYVF